MKIIVKEGRAYINVNRSKFYSYADMASDRDSVEKKLKTVKKEHNKARHVCNAFRIGLKEILEYSTDAGEPSGTAGNPILNSIKKNELTNTGIIVVRYFGGKKLGVKGLIAAYGDSASAAIQKAEIKEIEPYRKYFIKCSYRNFDSILNKIRSFNGKAEKENFEKDISFTALIPENNSENAFLLFKEMQNSSMILNLNDKGIEWC